MDPQRATHSLQESNNYSWFFTFFCITVNRYYAIQDRERMSKQNSKFTICQTFLQHRLCIPSKRWRILYPFIMLLIAHIPLAVASPDRCQCPLQVDCTESVHLLQHRKDAKTYLDQSRHCSHVHCSVVTSVYCQVFHITVVLVSLVAVFLCSFA